MSQANLVNCFFSPLLVLAGLFGLNGCTTITQEGFLLSARQSNERRIALMVVDQVARSFQLEDDRWTAAARSAPIPLRAYSRFDGLRVSVVERGAGSLFVSTNSYHLTDAEDVKQRKFRLYLEARFHEALPDARMQVVHGNYLPEWVVLAP